MSSSSDYKSPAWDFRVICNPVLCCSMAVRYLHSSNTLVGYAFVGPARASLKHLICYLCNFIPTLCIPLHYNTEIFFKEMIMFNEDIIQI